MTFRFLPLLPILIAFGCNGPVVLLPGGKLNGETRPVPADWAFAGDYGTAQLETRPEDPYSVNVAFTVERLLKLRGDVLTRPDFADAGYVLNDLDDLGAGRLCVAIDAHEATERAMMADEGVGDRTDHCA